MITFNYDNVDYSKIFILFILILYLIDLRRRKQFPPVFYTDLAQ